MWTVSISLLPIAIAGALSSLIGLVALGIAHIFHWKETEKETAQMYAAFGFVVAAIAGTAYGIQQL